MDNFDARSGYSPPNRDRMVSAFTPAPSRKPKGCLGVLCLMMLLGVTLLVLGGCSDGGPPAGGGGNGGGLRPDLAIYKVPRQGGSWGGGWREQDWYTGRFTAVLIGLALSVLVGYLIQNWKRIRHALVLVITGAFLAACGSDYTPGGGGRPTGLEYLRQWDESRQGRPWMSVAGGVLIGTLLVVAWTRSHHARLAALRSTR